MGSIAILLLIAVGFPANRSPGEKSLAAAVASGRELLGAMTDRTEEQTGVLEYLGPTRSPGDFVSDLYEALEEGIPSGLVHLSTEKEERLFERMREASRSESGLNLGLFRVDVHDDEDEGDGIRVYELRSEGGKKAQGMIRMEQLEERWHVVGVAPSTLSGPDASR